MPTNANETIRERYQREHNEYVSSLERQVESLKGSCEAWSNRLVEKVTEANKIIEAQAAKIAELKTYINDLHIRFDSETRHMRHTVEHYMKIIADGSASTVPAIHIHNTAEIAELRKDAERYRFARSRAHVAVTPRLKSCLWIIRGVFEVKYNAAKIYGFDAAIDKAIDAERSVE